MKSIILMTTAIFLVSAPSPDSKTISEMSAGFLSMSSETALSAAEVAPKVQIDSAGREGHFSTLIFQFAFYNSQFSQPLLEYLVLRNNLSISHATVHYYNSLLE